MTNYEKYFGTPEKLAALFTAEDFNGCCLLEKLHPVLGYKRCTECPFWDNGNCMTHDKPTVLKWLQEECE